MQDTPRPNNKQDPINLLSKQINQLVSRELKNSQILKQLTEQYKAKQSSKEYFEKQTFSKQTYLTFIEVQNFFQKINARLSAFPIFQKISNLLSTISLQYLQIFKFTTQKWQCEYRVLEDQLKNKAILPPLKTDLCLKCCQNKWHQQIKSQKHHIFNLRINDPFSYYQQSVLNNKEPYGQQIDHKKIQQKLSQLALGVQMEQQCLNQLLEEMSQQGQSANKNYSTPSTAENQPFSLPFMPMLRSVFHHARGTKKTLQDIGIQTFNAFQKYNVPQILPAVQNEANDQKDKNQSKLMTQITDKSIHIKNLEEKIIEIQKSQQQLKLQNSILNTENQNLQRRNSNLQMQLNIIKSRPIHTKVKIINKNKSLEKNKGEQSTTVDNKISNPPTLYATIHQSVIITSMKIRPNGLLQSKFKAPQPQNNKTMFIPNLYQALRQSATPGNFGSTFSIQRSSDKFDEEGLTSVVDFPSIRPSIYSNQVIDQKKTVLKSAQKKFDHHSNHQENQIMLKTLPIKSNKKLKQITKAQINNKNTIKDWVKSQNHSPEAEHKNRRKGKFQDRQSLLKMLYSQQIKEDKQKPLNYDFFKKSYQNFVIRIKGINDFDNEIPRMPPNHLQKKSTASIKQYLRNDANEFSALERDSISVKRKGSQVKYPRYSTCLKQIMNNIFAQGLQMEQFSQIPRQKPILNKEQLGIMTQILAYMIQLKVNNLNAYTKVKTIISIESVQRKKGHNQYQTRQQSKQLKNCITVIITTHRKCKTKQQNHNYCTHIYTFIKSIIALMEP